MAVPAIHKWLKGTLIVMGQYKTSANFRVRPLFQSDNKTECLNVVTESSLVNVVIVISILEIVGCYLDLVRDTPLTFSLQHLAQNTRPHSRQWCLRLSWLNLALHAAHALASASDTHLQ